jgi:multidrug efflux pump subunit AcrA (membrane-fusion protein)
MSKFRFLIASLPLFVATAALAQQPPAPVVQTALVAETEIAPTVAVPGTIYSRNDVQVTAGVAGQLTMVAEPGTVVQSGQTIASIDKTPLLLQRAEQEVMLERAEINIRQLNSQLRRQQELRLKRIATWQLPMPS